MKKPQTEGNFKKVRLTKNKVRFEEELNTLQAPLSDTFYLSKQHWAILGSPERIKIIVKKEKEE